MSSSKKKRKLRPWVMLTLIFGGLALLGLAITSLVKPAQEPAVPAVPQSAEAGETQEQPAVEETAEENTDEFITDSGGESREGWPIFSDTESLLLLANKKHPLPEGYEPYDLREPNVSMVYGSAPLRDEAASAMEEMFAAAANDGITLILGSGYRSQEYQDQLYSGYSAQYGWEVADTISSRPGYSDHQTGLAADISDHDGATYLTQDMEYTPEGIWLKDHAHEYGFIMRYPKGKDEITGYSYEPWHFRYVGRDYATAIWNIDEFYTFEEYFGVEGGGYN